MAERLRIAIVAGEASGDELGASLLRAFVRRGVVVEAFGVGGARLAGEGHKTLFPLEDIAVMGLGPVIRRLPLLVRRIRETAAAIIAAKPDILLTIDSPDFSKRVARRIKAALPALPMVHWVCPTVWAWRPGRARAMRGYIDHVLCLLPFEPDALARLNGPPGTYVGHPLVEQIGAMRPQTPAEAACRAARTGASILILPGSRLSEISRLMPLFAKTVDRLAGPHPDARWIIPTLPHLVAPLRTLLGERANSFAIIAEPDAKRAAMREARAALAASGTVTLELALAGIPMVAAYRLAGWEALVARRLIRVPSVILPNLVLGENAVPEFLQDAATPAALAGALGELLDDSPAFEAQRQAFGRLETVMRQAGANPSDSAAALLLDLARKARDRRGHDRPDPSE